MVLLTEELNYLIICYSEGNWLLRSCDLTSVDYILCSYNERMKYVNNPQRILELKQKIFKDHKWH